MQARLVCTWLSLLKLMKWGDLPSGPMVKILPSSSRDVGLIPRWGAKIPTSLAAKNRSNIVTNSIKTLKEKRKEWEN